MKIYIKGQAQPKSKVLDKIEDKVIQVMQHLAYLYLFEDAQDRNHWKHEIWQFISMMPKIRIGAKVRYLKPDEFLQGTYCQHNNQHDFEFVLESAPELKQNYIPNADKIHDTSRFKEICDEYFHWLADQICIHGNIRPSECYTKLDGLGL